MIIRPKAVDGSDKTMNISNLSIRIYDFIFIDGNISIDHERLKKFVATLYFVLTSGF